MQGIETHHLENIMSNEKPKLNEGETLIGLIGNANGEAYHLVLLPGDNDEANWMAQLDWAESIGGDLPDRVEQAMLFKHAKDKFKPGFYWSKTSKSNVAAWYQNFNNGNQAHYRWNRQLRARAVRRVVIE